MALRTDDLRAVLFGRVTLAVFALTGAVFALSEWGPLPREALLVAAPAIVAALLLDTFLYNEYLISTPMWFLRVEIYAFLFVEATLVGAAVHLLRPYWPGATASGE